MHQTRKGNAWRFGMKLHVGIDAASGLTHSLSTAAANAADVTAAHRFLRGGERGAYGDAGCPGAGRRPELTDAEVEWLAAMRPGWRRQLKPSSPLAQRERQRAALRAKVEHPFLYIKQRFGYRKTRYRGLATNHQWLALPLGFANLLIAEPQLA